MHNQYVTENIQLKAKLVAHKAMLMEWLATFPEFEDGPLNDLFVRTYNMIQSKSIIKE